MSKSYRQLCADERIQIATLRSQNFTLPQIAQVLGRHRSTVWRGSAAQPRPAQRLVPQRAGAGTGGGPAQAFPAQPAL